MDKLDDEKLTRLHKILEIAPNIDPHKIIQEGHLDGRESTEAFIEAYVERGTVSVQNMPDCDQDEVLELVNSLSAVSNPKYSSHGALNANITQLGQKKPISRCANVDKSPTDVAKTMSNDHFPEKECPFPYPDYSMPFFRNFDKSSFPGPNELPAPPLRMLNNDRAICDSNGDCTIPQGLQINMKPIDYKSLAQCKNALMEMKHENVFTTNNKQTREQLKSLLIATYRALDDMDSSKSKFANDNDDIASIHKNECTNNDHGDGRVGSESKLSDDFSCYRDDNNNSKHHDLRFDCANVTFDQRQSMYKSDFSVKGRNDEEINLMASQSFFESKDSKIVKTCMPFDNESRMIQSDSNGFVKKQRDSSANAHFLPPNLPTKESSHASTNLSDAQNKSSRTNVNIQNLRNQDHDRKQDPSSTYGNKKQESSIEHQWSSMQSTVDSQIYPTKIDDSLMPTVQSGNKSLVGNITKSDSYDSTEGMNRNFEKLSAKPIANGCFQIAVKANSVLRNVQPGEYYFVPKNQFLDYIIHKQQQVLRSSLKKNLRNEQMALLHGKGVKSEAVSSLGKEIKREPELSAYQSKPATKIVLGNLTSNPITDRSAPTDHVFHIKSEDQKSDKLEEISIKSEEIRIEQLVRQARLDDQYSLILKELPDLDAEALYAQTVSFEGDETELRKFIAEQKEGARLSRKAEAIDQQFDFLCAEFPHLDRAELFSDCNACDGNVLQFNKVVAHLREAESLRREREIAINNAISILSDVNTSFLEAKMKECAGDLEEFNRLIVDALESGNYDKIESEDPAVRSRRASWHYYVTNFNPDNYLRIISDPVESFLGITAKNAIDDDNTRKFVSWRYYGSPAAAADAVTAIRSLRSLTAICDELDNKYAVNSGIPPEFQNVDLTEAFLHEIVFIANRKLVTDAFERMNQARARKLRAARENNTLLQCDCCFDDLLFELAVPCPKKHLFCRNCIRRYCETSLSEGKTKLKCIAECEENLRLVALEPALPPSLFEKIVKKVISAEVLEAQIPDLEACKFCEYAYIPAPTDKIFKCGNPDCAKETCRSCDEPAHIPLRCKEVERPRDVAARRRIEEIMSQTLFRTCQNCNKKIIKTEGCDSVTCQCGAVMCYACGMPRAGHIGCRRIGDVYAAGVQARDQELAQDPDLHLVHDPTRY